MTDWTSLAALLYRADWTTWSVSAEVVVRRNQAIAAELGSRARRLAWRHWAGLFPPPHRWPGQGRAGGTAPGAPVWEESRYRILIAPGGRYRFEPAFPVEPDEETVRLVVCDGEHFWVICGDEADRYAADPGRTPIEAFIRPGRLLTGFRLTDIGTTEQAGRAARQVRATPRQPADPLAVDANLGLEADLAVDAQLGLVLREVSRWGTAPVTVTQWRDLAVDPAAASDPASFAPPPGFDVEAAPQGARADFGQEDDAAPAGSDFGDVAAFLGSAAVGLAARRLARQEPPRGDEPDAESAMPESAGPRDRRPAPSEPESAGPRDRRPAPREPVSGRLIDLLAGAGTLPLHLSAEVHRWADADLARRARTAFAQTPLSDPRARLGFAFFGDARWPPFRDSHRVAELRVAQTDRYRIDYRRDDRPRQPLAVACDGRRLRKLYHNRMIVSPAEPLLPEFVRLLDPAWLLGGWPLTAIGPDLVAGRSAILIAAEPPPWPPGTRPIAPLPATEIQVAVDAELGVVLRQVSYADGRPAVRFELRGLVDHGDDQAGDFGLDAGPGVAVFESDGDPLRDLDLPDSIRTTGDAAATAVSGARSAIGWLSAEARRIMKPQ